MNSFFFSDGRAPTLRVAAQDEIAPLFPWIVRGWLNGAATFIGLRTIHLIVNVIAACVIAAFLIAAFLLTA